MNSTTLRLLSLFTLLSIAGVIAQAGIIAQYDPFADSGMWFQEVFYSNYMVAQTFVPTVTGTVVSIDTPINKTSASTTTIPITFRIMTTWQSTYNGLQPDFDNVLSTGTLSPSVTPRQWVNTSMTPSELQAGTTYVLMATAIGTDQDYRWWCKEPSTYASGNELLGYLGATQLGNQTNDLAFRINASDAVPEPATWVGLGMGLLALGALKRRISGSRRRSG